MTGIRRCKQGSDGRVFIDAANIYPGDSSPCPRNALGRDWGGVVGIDGIHYRAEEMLNVRRDINGYIQRGLELFSLDDGVPIGLKARLFNRYEHWSSGYEDIVSGFKRWYFTDYLDRRR